MNGDVDTDPDCTIQQCLALHFEENNLKAVKSTTDRQTLFFLC